MKKKAVVLLMSVFLVGLGFNTLDAMVWQFYWNGDFWRSVGIWAWTPSLSFDVWWSYFLGGIVPLVVGAFVLGLLIGKDK